MEEGLEGDIATLPVPEDHALYGRKGFRLRGVNRADDLFMGVVCPITDPNVSHLSPSHPSPLFFFSFPPSIFVIVPV